MGTFNADTQIKIGSLVFRPECACKGGIAAAHEKAVQNQLGRSLPELIGKVVDAQIGFSKKDPLGRIGAVIDEPDIALRLQVVDAQQNLGVIADFLGRLLDLLCGVAVFRFCRFRMGAIIPFVLGGFF
jgi:hypothetical protein